jgi:hypothetical protein
MEMSQLTAAILVDAATRRQQMRRADLPLVVQAAVNAVFV